MRSIVAAFVMAMLITAIATPFVRRAALAAGAVDEPGARRVHTRRVPRLGGIAIAIGFFLPLVALFAIRTHAALIFFSTGSITAGLAAGSLLVVGAGLVDDLKGLGAKAKLLIQTAAAVMAFAGGMRIEGHRPPGDRGLEPGLVRPAGHGPVDRRDRERDEPHRRPRRSGRRRRVLRLSHELRDRLV